jgi:hypothetical protein
MAVPGFDLDLIRGLTRPSMPRPVSELARWLSKLKIMRSARPARRAELPCKRGARLEAKAGGADPGRGGQGESHSLDACASCVNSDGSQKSRWTARTQSRPSMVSLCRMASRRGLEPLTPGLGTT